MKKDIKNRHEEEEYIKEYILENINMDLEESEELSKTLDIKTIEAFEEAMEKVANEYDREKSFAEIFRNYIQDKNYAEELFSINEFMNNLPDDISLEEIENIMKNFDDYEELSDIIRIERKNDTYFYDSNLWTDQYANTAVLLKEKDVLEAIAQRARKDCKIYPRPLQVSALENPPYNYTQEEVFSAIEKMKKDERYKDINTVKASNGGVCIYSLDHMSEKYARALCEEIEVEWKKQQ